MKEKLKAFANSSTGFYSIIFTVCWIPAYLVDGINENYGNVYDGTDRGAMFLYTVPFIVSPIIAIYNKFKK